MSDDKMNGTPAAPAAPDEELPGLDEAPAPAATASQVEKMLDTQVMNPLGMMLRGIMVSTDSAIPPGLLMASIARCTGQLLSLMLTGNPLDMTTKAREDFRAQFSVGMKRVPLIQAANFEEVIKRAVHGKG